MLIMHNDGTHFSDTETGDIFGIEKNYRGDYAEWWIEQDSTHDDVSAVILGSYATQDEAIDALRKLYDASVNRLQSFMMP